VLKVPDDARNFPTIPSSLEYSVPDDHGYLALSIIYQKQRKSSILDYLIQLQTTIRERIASLGITILDSPWGGQGLYLYPSKTIHCVLLTEVFESQPTFADICSHSLANHPWLNMDISDIAAFEVQPRWLFTFPRKMHPEDPGTCSFTVQIYLEQFVIDQLQPHFGGATKVYQSRNVGLVRGATNLARFMSDRVSPVREVETEKIQRVFEDLHKQFLVPQRFVIDQLSVVKSNSWMSNPNPEVKSYQLRLR
jgi:hypothetical protein